MEIIIKRYQSLIKTLKTFDKILERLKELNQKSPDYDIFRDSSIQRFEYCIDIFWKLLKEHLNLNLGLSLENIGSSPKMVFKACVTAQIMTPQEHILCIDLIENRNISSHCYNENLAEEISHHLQSYYNLMKTIAERIGPFIEEKND